MKFFIISAMKEEIEPLLQIKKCEKIDECNSQKIYYYKKDRNEFFIFNSGIGKVNATITTTAMILKYNPDVVYSIGTAGGVFETLNVCDVVIADKIAFHDVNVTSFGYQYGQLPNKEKYFTFEDTSHILKIITNAYTGTILTGDQFIDTKKDKLNLLENFDNVYAVEMESCAIVMTCQTFNTKCFVIRTISDLVNSDSSVSFENYLDEASKIFVKLVDGLEQQID